MSYDDDQAIRLLTGMVRTPSLCGQEDEVAGLLVRSMSEHGFATRRDEVGNVVGTIGPNDGSSIVILGHMDTVPGVVASEQADGAVYGRGAVDAKGPLATAVVSASRAAATTRARLTVVGAVQEEGPSLGARHLVSWPVPDYLIVAEPSQWDSVVLGYKGSQRFELEITVPMGHSAGPERTASERAIDFWNRLTAWCESCPAEREDGFYRVSATMIAMHSENDGLADSARLHVALRLPPGMTPEAAQDAVRALAPDARIDFANGEPAVRSRKNTPLVASFLRAIRTEHGKPRFKLKTGTSDMNVVGPAWQCPMVAYGPGDSKLDHTPHEHIRIEDFQHAVRVLTRVLEEL